MADQGDGFEPITSQEDFDRMVKERLERERRKVREQFAGYDELKEKAAKWDEAQQAGKSDLEKARERINELEASAKRRDEADKARELRAKVSKATGVPAELISGADEDSMTEFAKQVAAFAKKPSAPVVTEAGRSGGSGKGADGTPRASFAKFMEENFPKK